MRKTRTPLGCLLGCLIFLQPAPSGATFWPLEERAVERALRKPNVHERRAAARRIAELSPTVARTALEQALGDQDREVRLIGLRTARAFELVELSSEARESLKSRDESERVLAVRLIALEPNGEEVAALESMASDAHVIVRREIAEALGRVPKAHSSTSAAKLLSMLDDPDASVRVEVAAALGRLGEQSAILALAARLNDPEADVRAQVALALGAIGSDRALPALQVALLDAQDSVVAAVVRALGALDSEDAISGLVAIAEKAPLRPPGEAALEALVRLSKYPSARRHVLQLLESPEHRAVLQQVFVRPLPGSIPVLTECVRTLSSDLALVCASALSQRNAGVAAIIEAQEQGRLAASRVLELLTGVSNRTAIVLALERLSLADSAEFQTALLYLGSLSELPKEAEGPLTEALKKKGLDALGVASIAHILGSVQKASQSKELVGLLTATDSEIRRAASRALVRRGASGEALRSLLLGEEPVATGALEGLSGGMTQQQADVLVGLVAEGCSGRRSAFLSVFYAMPASLPDRTLEALWRAYGGALGAERDALLYPLVMAGKPALWGKLIANSSQADRVKVAQLSWYQPRAVVLARRLIRDKNSEVAALSALSLGRNGTSKDAEALGRLALSTHPHLVRAAAVHGLILLAERGATPAVSEEIFSADSCESAHDAYRAQVTRLAATLGRRCGGRTLEDVLTRDPDPRRRRLAAALLRTIAPESPALGTCRFYEVRHEVAKECSSPQATPQPSSMALPYRVHQLWEKGRPLKLTPFTVRVPGSAIGKPEVADFGLRLITDRAGQVVMPAEAYEAVDANWFL